MHSSPRKLVAKNNLFADCNAPGHMHSDREESVQSHYIEVAQGDIFKEQKMRFGLVLGRLAILKKTIGGRL